MNYDLGLNVVPSLEKDVAYGLSKQPLVVKTLTKYFDEPITRACTRSFLYRTRFFSKK